jgi:hypothetical protein
MFKRILLIAAAVLGISGAALATGSGNAHNENHTKTCIKIQTDSPRIHNKHCKGKTPEVTPTPELTPESTPDATPEATPTVTRTPSVTTKAANSTKVSTPAVLPSVGGSGRLNK